MQVSESCGPDIFPSSDQLSKLFFSQYEPCLKQASSKLQDVLQSQDVLTQSLTQEHMKIKETAVNEIQIAMTLVNHYKMKLQKIKKDMVLLQELSLRLRKESAHLQQLKQKEALKRGEQAEKEWFEDQQLVAQLSD